MSGIEAVFRDPAAAVDTTKASSSATPTTTAQEENCTEEKKNINHGGSGSTLSSSLNDEDKNGSNNKSSADHDYKPDVVSQYGISGNYLSFVLGCAVQYSLQRCPCTIVTSSDRNIGAAAITPTT
ncbi:hypothetical protein FRACYDRAFT_245743 [Fragilariopsis cylindrus CCMP1102]|uniref:Uncharacterized protein n=1 Tax=Fragilariopsis cylindrus CCMP1102 TaxID=635003 RepID=A0A1E7EZD1_9STRA|nr:hypothetical protein FRACYDRAFT_245743 [Fragilariopsis cylindrus CCMP1102]|eukprot:OEU11358.1 hypothetical protein FRACYDRAFT_245743 [Fragilariopsis cylindrus CCMP1102]